MLPIPSSSFRDHLVAGQFPVTRIGDSYIHPCLRERSFHTPVLLEAAARTQRWSNDRTTLRSGAWNRLDRILKGRRKGRRKLPGSRTVEFSGFLLWSGPPGWSLVVSSLTVKERILRAASACCYGPFWKGLHAIPEQVLSNQVTDGSTSSCHARCSSSPRVGDAWRGETLTFRSPPPPPSPF